MVKRHTKQDMQIKRYKTRHAERYTGLLMNTLCAARTWIKRSVQMNRKHLEKNVRRMSYIRKSWILKCACVQTAGIVVYWW